MASDSRPAIAVTMGDPCGIGPEVTAKALSRPLVYELCRPIVLGSTAALRAAIETAGNGVSVKAVHSLGDAAGDPGAIDVLDPENLDYGAISPGELSAEAGRASVEWVLKAGELAASGAVRANRHGAHQQGGVRSGRLQGRRPHGDLPKRQTGADEVATMLMAEELKVVHLTTHRSLRVACDYVTRENVLAKIALTHRSFEEWGYNSPRIGVAALNPHAGDGGLIGDEEATEIAPAVRAARSRGIDAVRTRPGGYCVQSGDRW